MSARDEILEGLREHLSTSTTYDGPEFYAETVVEYLETLARTGGYLIMNGHIRTVLQADVFGPSSWEITTETCGGDQDRWKRSYYS